MPESCSVRGCREARYHGEFGPPDFVDGSTMFCKKHYFEYITVHDRMIDVFSGDAREQVESHAVDYRAIRDKTRQQHPANYRPEIPWMRLDAE